MRKIIFLMFALMLTLPAVLPGAAQDVDPILLDQPSNIVFECSENLFLEIPRPAVIDYVLSGRHAEGCYLFFSAEFLFLEDTPWNGLDKNSFSLKRTLSDGTVETYPLNYMMTSMMGMKNSWKTFSDRLIFGTLLPMYLVFDVPTPNPQGWSLIFQPAERGGEAACEIEIPLKVKVQ